MLYASVPINTQSHPGLAGRILVSAVSDTGLIKKGLNYQITLYYRMCKQKWDVSPFNAVTSRIPLLRITTGCVCSQCIFPAELQIGLMH